MAFEKILVVDDDRAIADLVALNLRNQGYDVTTASCGEEAVRAAEPGDFSLIILDIMMPGMDGFETLSAIRKRSNIPVLFLSARGDEPDKIIGLGLGADDYITKPFSPGELAARVRAHIRRYRSGPGRDGDPGKGQGRDMAASCPRERDEAGGFRADAARERGSTGARDFGDLIIDPCARRVALRGNQIELTRTEFDILLFLSESPGRAYTFEQIYRHVWKDEYIGTANTVMAHIKNLREKLGESPRDHGFIRTVWGVGYKFVQD